MSHAFNYPAIGDQFNPNNICQEFGSTCRGWAVMDTPVGWEVVLCPDCGTKLWRTPGVALQAALDLLRHVEAERLQGSGEGA